MYASHIDSFGFPGRPHQEAQLDRGLAFRRRSLARSAPKKVFLQTFRAAGARGTSPPSKVRLRCDAESGTRGMRGARVRSSVTSGRLRRIDCGAPSDASTPPSMTGVSYGPGWRHLFGRQAPDRARVTVEHLAVETAGILGPRSSAHDRTHRRCRTNDADDPDVHRSRSLAPDGRADDSRAHASSSHESTCRGLRRGSRCAA